MASAVCAEYWQDCVEHIHLCQSHARFASRFRCNSYLCKVGRRTELREALIESGLEISRLPHWSKQSRKLDRCHWLSATSKKLLLIFINKRSTRGSVVNVTSLILLLASANYESSLADTNTGQKACYFD